ncbi:hypothetical protein LJF28_04955 [Chryseobacterium indologenes]|uniref:hypothetical protein n=1 Tax=Chryseobacterium indologenes TaxID=253 RepID=UPI001D0D3182|nr:hypothetical protein [Chryseobacterium indologenes]UDQ55019.1 hypothetical protein LJF28_04955 [Chryseobacterium indologenes]
MAFEIDSQELEQKGFVFSNEQNLIMDYSKKINDRVRLVFAISPLIECFVWCLNEDYEDENMDGMKIHILPESIDEAILIAERINYIE